MEYTIETALDKLLEQYRRWYNVAVEDEPRSLLKAHAAFHEQAKGYIFVKSAETWSADRHEYVWFYSVSHLDKETWQSCLETTLKLGLPMVQPVKGHMSTYLVSVIVCDTADSEALRELRKCHIRKSYRFSLRGWMEVHTAAVEIRKSSVTSNGAGRNTAAFLTNVLYPKARHRFPFRNI